MGMGTETGMEMRNNFSGLSFLSGLMLFASGNALAQTPTADLSQASEQDKLQMTQQPSWIIKPRISLTETWTDNANLNQGTNSKQSDLITEIAPGINIQARTARLKGDLDYSLRGQQYAQNTNSARTQNSLNAFGTLEAIDNWLFLDFSGVIAQQSVSAFGTQSPSNTSVNSNSTETSTYRLSPYVRGQVGGMVEYLLRYNVSTTRSDSSTASGIDISQFSGQLKGSTPFQRLRWTIDGNQQATDYSTGRTTDAETYRGMLTYSLFPELRVSASGGWESNNYASAVQESRSTHGYGFDWNPTERTQLSVFKERRFFGDGHNISFSHRFPMSSIQYTNTRDVSVLPDQFGSVGRGTVYDQYYQLFSGITDPVVRANFVNAFLAAFGINPNSQVVSSFMSSQASVQRRELLSYVIYGARNSITLLANRSESQSLLATSIGNDDFSKSTTIRQSGLSVNFAHRLSEISNLNLLLSRQESTGGTGSSLKATTTMYQVNISTKLGAKTTGSLSVRRTEFDNSTTPYTENALIGVVTYIY